MNEALIAKEIKVNSSIKNKENKEVRDKCMPPQRGTFIFWRKFKLKITNKNKQS